MRDLKGLLEMVKCHFENTEEMDIKRMQDECSEYIDDLRQALSVVQSLYFNGSHFLDVNAGSLFGDTALMNASSIGWMDMVKFLCENGAKIILTREELKPLQDACIIHVPPSDGNAVAAASRGKQFEVVRYLMDRLEKEEQK